jgi:hypothetical protein
MDAYDKYTNLLEKNLADRVAICGRVRELFLPPTYVKHNYISLTAEILIHVEVTFFIQVKQ